MATLENIQGSSLVPDPSQALNLLLQSFGTQGQREAKAEQQRLTGVIADPESQQERQSAMIQLTSMNPQLGQAVQGILESGDKRQTRALLQQKEKGTRNALLVKGAKTFDGKKLQLNEWLKRIAIEPDSPDKAKRMQRISDLKNLGKDQLNVELQRIENAGKSIDVILKDQAAEIQAERVQGARFANRMLSIPVEQQIPELSALLGEALRDGDKDKENDIKQLINTPVAQRQAVFRDIAGQVPAAKPISVAKGATLIDPATRQPIFTAPTTAGGVDFAKPAVKDFTPESVEAAQGQGGSVSDLVLRPEALQKMGGDAFKIGREVKIRVGDKEFFVTPVTQRDKEGNVVTVGNLTPITGPDTGEKVDFISPLGETGKELQKRTVETAGAKTLAEQRALIKTRGDLTTEGKRAENDFVSMTAAVGAAENIPQLEQNLKLLERIETGGVDALVLATARTLGVESGDQAELTFNLRTNVLKQLKPTFGAQFTEREGKLLAEIQASETKSTEGNIRLMKRGIEIYNRAIERGKRAAKRRGETGQTFLEDIEAARQPLEPLGQDATAPAPAQAAPAPAPGGLTQEQKSRLEQLRNKQR